MREEKECLNCGTEGHEHSAAGIAERLREKPELYQHGGDHGSHEEDVPRRHPDSYGDGTGRRAGPGVVSAGGGVWRYAQLSKRPYEEDRQDPVGQGGDPSSPGPDRQLRAEDYWEIQPERGRHG